MSQSYTSGFIELLQCDCGRNSLGSQRPTLRGSSCWVVTCWGVKLPGPRRPVGSGSSSVNGTFALNLSEPHSKSDIVQQMSTEP
ncbi:MAG: hypothetical protein QOD58_2299 [Mycobacterium sp.]|nr:hypothetical protein [Mycobacterium sp.]